MKIGIIDDGLDQTHPFFSPAGFAYPAGFPKGQTAYTTPKVIVARAFPPPGLTWRNRTSPSTPSTRPRDPRLRDRCRQPGTLAGPVRMSGIAPRAYLGNYKVLGIPSEGSG